MDNGIEPIPWQNEYQTTFIRIHGHARVFILFVFRLGGTLSSREKSTRQQAGRPRTHARTTFGFGSAMTAEIQFREPTHARVSTTPASFRIHWRLEAEGRNEE